MAERTAMPDIMNNNRNRNCLDHLSQTSRMNRQQNSQKQ